MTIMGASGWVYYAPYQEDLEQAFQAMRQQVFESKKYDHFRERWEYEEAKEAFCVKYGVHPDDEASVEKLLQEVLHSNDQ